MKKISVYEYGNVVARVKYSSVKYRSKWNLDKWDGHNWCCGVKGFHMGLVLLKKGDHKGEYAEIHGSNYRGEKDYGGLVNDEQALELILKGNWKLLGDEDFARLKKLAEEKLKKLADEKLKKLVEEKLKKLADKKGLL